MLASAPDLGLFEAAFKLLVAVLTFFSALTALAKLKKPSRWQFRNRWRNQ
jgi:hypothetical protein